VQAQEQQPLHALNTNRNYILMEKEEKYFNIINERIKNNPITLFNAQ
jgi:DNA modification methylase